jgi:hypothetical protein
MERPARPYKLEIELKHNAFCKKKKRNVEIIVHNMSNVIFFNAL